MVHLASNQLLGPFPTSWQAMSNLSRMDVSGNCGLCGPPLDPPSPDFQVGARVGMEIGVGVFGRVGGSWSVASQHRGTGPLPLRLCPFLACMLAKVSICASPTRHPHSAPFYSWTPAERG